MFGMLRLSLTAMFQYLVQMASWVGVVRIIASFSSAAVAANTLAIKIVLFAILPSWGMSNAAATLVGQNLGARRPDRAEQAVWRTGHFNTAFLGGIGLIAQVTAAGHGWVVVAIGLSSIVGAITYTAGRKPLGYLGLGDLMVFVFFGPVAVCGTAGLQLGHVPPAAVWAALPIGALTTAILVVNNLRDREGDARAGKRTLVVRLGPTAARNEYAGLLALAWLLPLAGVALGHLPLGACAVWLALPLAIGCVRAIRREDGRGLNPWLGGTARLTLIFGCLFTLGVWPWRR